MIVLLSRRFEQSYQREGTISAEKEKRYLPNKKETIPELPRVQLRDSFFLICPFRVLFQTFGAYPHQTFPL